MEMAAVIQEPATRVHPDAAARTPAVTRTQRRVLVIDGHPRDGSFGSALASTLQRAAASRTEDCRFLRLRKLAFDPCHREDALEPDLLAAQEDIRWAEILVFVYPTWWGTMPALLKGFLDRLLRPGFAFAERSDGGWRGLLGGRAALLVTTMDTPRWIYRWLLGAPGHRAMRDATLGFCGIRPVRVLEFGPIRTSTLAQRRTWLGRAAREARNLERTFVSGPRARLKAWRAAARLHFYVQPWLAYTMGAAAANAIGQPWNWPAYLVGYIVIFLVEFITVIANELADVGSDRINANASPLTGGSRVLVEDRLSPSALRRGLVWAFVLFAFTVLLGVLIVPSATSLIVLGIVGLALGLAYSAPPVRLCARGLGELNVAVTHSFLVVLAGFALQGAAIFLAVPWALSLPLCLAVLPAIILAGFPDYEADEATGKCTLAVRIGRKGAAILAGTIALSAAVLPLFMDHLARGWMWWVAIPAIPHAAWLCRRLRTYLRAGTPPGRIDALLILALTFMIWFAAVPLAAILLRE